MIYTIDFDLFKELFRCPNVSAPRWRVSASGKGFHFTWECGKRWCKRCRALERRYDDPRRQERDARRKPRNRRVLWDRKGTRQAGPWQKVGSETGGAKPEVTE